MKSPTNAAPAYTRTTNVDFAAAVSVLGIEVKIDHSIDRISGQTWKTLLLGMDSVDYKAIGAKPSAEDDDELPLPSHNTQLIVSLIRKGKLATTQPTHPTLDVLRACAAADALREWIKTGTDHILKPVKGCDRWKLTPAPIPHSLKTGPCLWGTRDLKMAAMLCVLGYPIARLEGSAPQTLFCFTGQHSTIPGLLAPDLAQGIRTKRLQATDPEHAALWMLQGLINRDAIGDMMAKKSPLVLIRAPGTGRASLVSVNAKGRTMDRVKNHLRIL